MGKLTAYDAYKHYVKLFAKTSQRNVYYQLQRGVELDLFTREEVEEEGNFSWGFRTRKVYYGLKSLDSISVDKRIVDYFEEEKRKYNEIAQNITT